MHIKTGAFAGCVNLRTINGTLLPGKDKIDDGAFYGCPLDRRSREMIARINPRAFDSPYTAENFDRLIAVQNEAMMAHDDMKKKQEDAESAMAALLSEIETENKNKNTKRDKAKNKRIQRKMRHKPKERPVDDRSSEIEPSEAPVPPSADVCSSESEPSEELVPDEFLCPITHEMMDDPVVASDGHTYEREAIKMWFKKRLTSPKSGSALESSVVFPNHLLRRQIAEYKERA